MGQRNSVFAGGVFAGAITLAASLLFHWPVAVAGELSDAVFESRDHQSLAVQAYGDGQLEAAAGHFEQALALRPGHPTLTYNLAAVRARLGEHDAALGLLRSYAAFGTYSNIAQDTDFAALRGNPEFEALSETIAGHLQPVIASSVAFTSTQPMGLIEGIAYDAPRNRFFLTSISEGRIFVVDGAGPGGTESTEGTAREPRIYLTMAEHKLWGLMGIKIDQARDLMWVTSGAIIQTAGVEWMMQYASGAIAIDLTTDRMTRSFRRLPIGRRHTFGDLVIGEDGTVFITNSLAPQIFVVPKGEAQEAGPMKATDFYSLQGIVIAPQGEQLIVSDYGMGLLSVKSRKGRVTRLDAPDGATLIGIDGLYRYGDDQLIAVQNGIRPNRVLRITMDRRWRAVRSVEVLESAHPAYDEPTLGVVVGDDFYYIANSGWPLYANGIPDAEALAGAKPLTVLKLPLK